MIQPIIVVIVSEEAVGLTIKEEIKEQVKKNSKAATEVVVLYSDIWIVY